jgi:hypothetical protein
VGFFSASRFDEFSMLGQLRPVPHLDGTIDIYGLDGRREPETNCSRNWSESFSAAHFNKMHSCMNKQFFPAGNFDASKISGLN